MVESTLSMLNGEFDLVEKVVDVDVVSVVHDGWFSEWAVEVDGSGRMGRGVPFGGQFNSIG